MIEIVIVAHPATFPHIRDGFAFSSFRLADNVGIIDDVLRVRFISSTDSGTHNRVRALEVDAVIDMTDPYDNSNDFMNLMEVLQYRLGREKVRRKDFVDRS